ncbi:MAG: dihydropteroate synthase [Rickettsiales bacterium]|nr:dihydropteroate synthase [Rickettsiales bacterium]
MTTKIVGILNITPDSFSDGGKFDSLDGALNHLQQMINDGADIIDIGAESTRPQAKPITADEEWQRLEKILPPVISIAKNASRQVKTSIDSYHFSTIKKSYELGIDIINDVSSLIDEKIIAFIAEKNLPTILMHNQKIQEDADCVINRNLNLADKIIDWAKEKIADLKKKNISSSQLIFDPGIGFAKNALQSISILKNITKFHKIGLPIYLGHSKKSFLDAIDFSNYGENLDRSQKTLIISKYLIAQKIDFIRVHDVELTKKIKLKESKDLYFGI